eukprot:1157665-Pelagomonas_calceolata.AAC.15
MAVMSGGGVVDRKELKSLLSSSLTAILFIQSRRKGLRSCTCLQGQPSRSIMGLYHGFTSVIYSPISWLL